MSQLEQQLAAAQAALASERQHAQSASLQLNVELDALRLEHAQVRTELAAVQKRAESSAAEQLVERQTVCAQFERDIATARHAHDEAHVRADGLAAALDAASAEREQLRVRANALAEECTQKEAAHAEVCSRVWGIPVCILIETAWFSILT